ncbi:proteophosphoglycan 5 [Pochonia chlamydosporia 170]|uniref:Proteophosphoglycan 5 n=1 Tax=Pochonia chlamydosporia 170 TaxID=1380566 RepID=A0A179FB31_METCM|nr:proteophosphoglycan 5 [Pochonia chlamydosporia 170]OAQ62283.1 proteophosphoglycan 5 [Pochonia chlamydosporia 170]
MSETPSQQRTTPARRKYGRQSTKSAGQKAYASENDVAALENTRLLAPKTPNKAAEAANPATDFYPSQVSNSKNKTKNKTRSKNVPTSPDSAQHGRQTPPQRPGSIKSSGLSTAFAGATFHASPAPSALPIPSFLSKSSSDSPVGLDKSILQEPSPPATEVEIPTPFRPSSAPKTNESPLDFMFRAHRQEKERYFQETTQVRNSEARESPQTSPWGDMRGAPKPSSLPLPRQTHFRQQAAGIDASELDGTPGRPLGPAFSTPYQERIKAARSTSNNNTPRDSGQTTGTGSSTEPQIADPTDALKKFLFGHKNPANSGTFPTTTDSKSLPNPGSSVNTTLPTGTQTVVNSTRHNQIEEMENDLRRILKLDMASRPASGDRTYSPR